MGAILALITWSAWTLALVAVGFVPATLLGARSLRRVRMSIWLGLLLVVIVILGLSIVVPLGSAVAAIVLLIVVSAGVAASTWILVRGRPHRRARPWTDARLWPTALTVALVACIGYLAVAAMGPATNYDTGLYHLGAIQYSFDYSAIPGIANIYFPFGYNNSLFPLAAILGNGPWDGQGFRLVNGLLTFLLVVELLARVWSRRLSVGMPVLLVATTTALFPLVSLSDFWTTSPSSDPAVMIVTFVSLAYLADAAGGTRPLGRAGIISVIAALIAVSMRPLMLFFLAGLLAALVILGWGRRTAGRPSPQQRSGWALVGVAALLLGLAQSARDYLLSGWLEYPLAVLPFDVAWRASDPTSAQLATLGNARDPANAEAAMHGWGWVPAWTANLVNQWEPFAFLALTLAAVVLLVVSRRSRVPRASVRRLLVVLLPSAATLVVWWLLTPPSFRFAWGPLFGLPAVAAGWGLFRLVRDPRPVHLSSRQVLTGLAFAAAVPLVILVGYNAVARLDTSGNTESRTWRLGPLSISYQAAPVPMPAVDHVRLSSGLEIVMPLPSEQCWGRFPICTPQISQDIAGRGSGVQDGFARS